MRQAWLPAIPESAPHARAIVRDAAADLGLDDETTWQLMLATTEAVANAVEHGEACDPRGIEMRLNVCSGRLEVEVSNRGPFPRTVRTSKRRGEGGRGMALIEAVMDNLEVLPEGGTTRVRFEKRLAVA